MTMTTTLKIDNLRDEIAPLYCRYSGQTNAQPAYVEMDDDGIIAADYSGEIGGGVSFDVFHSRTLRWGVAERVRGDALADLLESDEMRVLFERVYNGHSIEWDGNNNVGHLDDDARAASDEIEVALTALGEDESAMGVVWDVDQWLEYSAFDDIWDPGKSLDEAVAAVEKSAEEEGIELDGNVEKYLLDRAERANDRDDCYRPEVLAALIEDGRHPLRHPAYESGYEDGEEKVGDEAATAEQVEQWFAEGTLDPDEALINACGMPRLAKVLGLTVEQVNTRGVEWNAALDQYNRGYRAGARSAVAGE
jgi:hypothetical protein